MTQNRRSMTNAASTWLRHHDQRYRKPRKSSYANSKAEKFKRWQKRQQKTGAASPVRHIDPETGQPS
jgi:hypothetical protein